MNAFRIERVSSNSFETCHGCFNGKRCNAKIAKYQHSIVAPTFLKIEKEFKLNES